MAICRIEEIQSHIPFERGAPLTIEVDGEPLPARAGETIATAILANGRPALRWTRTRGRPRALYCGIGVCFDCLVIVEGRGTVRACQTFVAPGMRVSLPRPRNER